MKVRAYTTAVSAMFFILAAIFTSLYLVAVLLAVSGRYVMTPVNHIIQCAAIFTSVLVGAKFSVKNAEAADAERKMRGACRVCTGIYLITVLVLTLFDTYYGRGGLSHLEKWQTLTGQELWESINLIPFKTVSLYVKALQSGSLSLENVIINLAGNSVVFMPFALFLPISFLGMRRCRCFTAVMITAVMTVELLQLALLTGACDIDDLILNVCGALIAFWIIRIPPVKRITESFFCTLL